MIIKSILDNDLYKFTMQQIVMFLFPDVKVEYNLINRGNHKFTKPMISKIKKAIYDMRSLRLKEKEYEKLSLACPYFNGIYLYVLKTFRFDPDEITFREKKVNKDYYTLEIIVSGDWWRTILWEVPVLAIVSEVYMAEQLASDELGGLWDPNYFQNKLNFLRRENIVFAEGGTRRRYNSYVQEQVIKLAAKNPNFIGTSNVYFGLKYDVKLIGTQAHEWTMFHGARYGYKEANKMALENWSNFYNGDLDVALTDTYGTAAFFKSFGKKEAKLWSTTRQDSGNPLIFTNQIIRHYESLGIDPLSKNIVFSDGLDVNKCAEISDWCQDKINCSFLIGTNFTNDIGLTPMNIVMKMVSCNWGIGWYQTIKLSDSFGKYLGPEKEIELCKRTLEIG